MNTFTYELIEQLDAHKGDADSELSVLGNTRDSRYYYALSPDRVNVLESFPWDMEMRVLEIGAAYGVYAGLAERTAQWDITDPAEEELEVVKRRYPDLTGGAGPLVRLLKEGEARTDLYDVVVLPLCGGIRTEEDRDPEMTVREATGYVRTGGILIVVADNRDALRYAEGETPEKNALFLDQQLIGSFAGNFLSELPGYFIRCRMPHLRGISIQRHGCPERVILKAFRKTFFLKAMP